MGERFQDQVEQHFDALGDGEWQRFDSLEEQVALEIYRRFLARHVRPGGRALDIGAGPGRFTIQLVTAGMRVVVGDLSRVQLELNERYVSEAGAAHGIEARLRLDICDLSELQDSSFDLVLAYGGPISYTFERAPDAMAELARVAAPGGLVVGSVMSLPGSARQYLKQFPPTIDAVGLDDFDAFLSHGDQRAILAAGAHPARLWRSADLIDLITGAGLELLATSSSHWLSLGDPATVAALMDDPLTRARFLDWEERLCAELGALDGGKHILFAARKPA